MLRSYKVRLDLNENQVILFNKLFGCYRVVYNQTILRKKLIYDTTGKYESKSETQKFIQYQLIKDPNFFYLKEFNSNILKSAQPIAEQAFSEFFKKKKGFPKLKKKSNKNSLSFNVNSISRNNLENDKFNFTKNLKDIKFSTSEKYRQIIISHRKEIQKITVSKNPSGEFYASILINSDHQPKKIYNKPVNFAVGIDLGLKDLMVTSTGEIIDNPNISKKYRKQLAKLQKRHSRKVKGSRNREKSRIKLARLHQKIKNEKDNFSNKLTTKIINENQVIVLEDLNIQGLLKNHKLARVIQDISWAEFIRQLSYKAERAGRTIIKVNRFFASTKTCSCCGSKQPMKLSDREFNCQSCSISINRDLNASINILKEGLRILENEIKTGKCLPEESVEISQIQQIYETLDESWRIEKLEQSKKQKLYTLDNNLIVDWSQNN